MCASNVGDCPVHKYNPSLHVHFVTVSHASVASASLRMNGKLPY